MSQLVTTIVEKVSRGKNSFASGKTYQHAIFLTLSKILLTGIKYVAEEVQGAKAGPDILVKLPTGAVGFECKNKGAFEGGGVKMIYNGSRLVFKEDGVHAAILDDLILYRGLNLPFYEGKKTIEDWNVVKSIFAKDIYIPADNDAISRYYKRIGTYYIQLEGKGLYHTGEDILSLGVPYFSCPISLRVRSTKHKKKGIPTDVTGALQYNKRELIASPYSLDGVLPFSMKLEE